MTTTQTSNRSRGIVLAIGTLAASLGAAACLVITDTGKYHRVDQTLAGDGGDTGDGAAGGSSTHQSLRFIMKEMAPHPSQYFEFRIVDNNNTIVSRGILDPLGANNVSIFVPNAIPRAGGPYRLDFYADQDNTRSFSGIGSVSANDHAWRIGPPLDTTNDSGQIAVVDGVLTVTFTHTYQFTDIDSDPKTGAKAPSIDTQIPADIHLTNMTTYVGQLVQVSVSDIETGHVLGTYRFPRLQTADIDAKIPGIIEPGVTYNVDLYVDANGDGKYQDPVAEPGNDIGWRQTVIAKPDGLNVTFDANQNFPAFTVAQPQ